MRVRDVAIKIPSISIETPIWKLANLFKKYKAKWLPITWEGGELGLVELSRFKETSNQGNLNLLKLEDIVDRKPLVVDENMEVESVLVQFEGSLFKAAVVLSNEKVHGIIERELCMDKRGEKKRLSL